MPSDKITPGTTFPGRIDPAIARYIKNVDSIAAYSSPETMHQNIQSDKEIRQRREKRKNKHSLKSMKEPGRKEEKTSLFESVWLPRNRRRR